MDERLLGHDDPNTSRTGDCLLFKSLVGGGDEKTRAKLGKTIFGTLMRMRLRNPLFWVLSICGTAILLFCYIIEQQKWEQIRDPEISHVESLFECRLKVKLQEDLWFYTPNTTETREIVEYLADGSGIIVPVESRDAMIPLVRDSRTIGVELRGDHDVFFYASYLQDLGTCLHRLLLSSKQPKFDRTVYTGRSFVYWELWPRPFGVLLATLVTLSAGLVVSVLAYEMMAFFSTNAFSLLVMNGAPKHVVMRSLVLCDAIFLSVLSVLYSFAVMWAPYFSKVDVPIILFAIFIVFVNLYMQLSLTVSIRYRIWFIIVVLVLLALNAGMPVMSFLFGFWSNMAGIRALMFFSAPFTAAFLFDDMSMWKEKGGSSWSMIGVGSYVSGGECLAWLVASTVFYGIIVAVVNAFVPFYRKNMAWGSIFRKSGWRRMLRLKNRTLDIGDNSEFLSVKHLNKTYKSSTRHVHALDNVNFSLKRGEFALLVGPNGSGKTTLVKSITGIIGVDSGEIFLGGFACANGVHHFQQGIGLCFQDDAFVSRLTVADHLRLMAVIRGCDKDEIGMKVQEMAEVLEVQDLLDRKPGVLSGGQKRKVSVAMALIGNPQMIVLDEPTVGVDVQSRLLIWKALSACKGSTAIITTHSLEEAVNIVDRLLVLQSGTIAIQGSPEQLRHDCQCGYFLKFIGDDVEGHIDALLDFIRVRIPGAEIAKGRSDSIHLPYGQNLHDLLVRLDSAIHGLGIRSYRLVTENLEDVIIRLVSANDDENNYLS